jgi:uncharacterized spore protein YtfJ
MKSTVTDNLQNLMGKVEEFITTKTVVGETMQIGDVIIVPLIDVAFGMGTGLNSAGDKNTDTGGGAVGAKLTPSAVVVIMNGTVQLVNVKNTDSANKLIDMVPGILSKLNIFGKKDEAESEE